MFQVGDKVKVLDDDQKGVVIRVNKNRVTILNEFDFEEIYKTDELLHDGDFEVGEVVHSDEEEVKKSVTRKEALAPKEIDLHIGQLVDSFRGMSHYEMLQIQLQTVRDEIERAQKERRQKLIFIHGHGSGKLKSELMKLLNSYAGIEIYDASFQKYKQGATEVKLKV